MNIQDYISSGILEAYMLGELSETDRVEVERNLLRYPELRAEFARLEEVQEKLVLQTAISPQPRLKASVLEKIQSKARTGTTSQVRDMKPINYWRYVAAASILIAICSSYMAYNYWNRLRDAQASLNEYIAQNQRIAQDYNNVNERLEKFEEDLRIIDDPAFKRVKMDGTDNAPEALAYVYWNADTKELFLKAQQLKQLVQGKQYQLWAIVDGKPVDAGVFDGHLSGLIRMKEISGAASFAVTIEPHGGNISPTLETMQVIGHVQKS